MSRVRSASGGGWLWRALPLLPSAFAVHQLRYMLAYGAGAGIALQRSGHSYLHSVTPWLVACAALAAGRFLHALGRAVSGQRTFARYTVSLALLWLICFGSLLAIFCCQELLEGLLTAGHPVGLDGVFGYGGWWAVPVAACVALVLAVWLHGARWALAAVARRHAAAYAARPTAGVPAWALPIAQRSDAPAPLVAGWSGRGPPRVA